MSNNKKDISPEGKRTIWKIVKLAFKALGNVLKTTE